MSGGFFRGTSADQDTRFSNKQAKLMKSQKFAPELENLVDMTKVKIDIMKPWIAKRVTELIGFEDEVLINFIYTLLEGKAVNGKNLQIQLTGFMERNTAKFMKELWVLLISAQQNASGVPQEFLDAKEEETKKKKAETDRVANEIRMKREKQDFDQMKSKMDGNGETPGDKHLVKHDREQPTDEKEMHKRNGSRGRSRLSHSSDSASRSPSLRRKRSESPNKFSYPGNYSNERRRARSISGAPKSRSRSVSSERRHQSPPRRSITPRRRQNMRRSPSPQRHRSSRHRSPSPTKYRVRPSWRYRSRSPLRRRSRSPMRHRSRTPMRRSPIRRRSPSPVRRRSRSPIRRRSRSPVRRRSPSLVRGRSPSPVRRRSPSPLRRQSPSPVISRSLSPVRRRSLSPVRRGSSSSRSISPVRQLSPPPVRRSSPSPYGRRPPPQRRRSPTLEKRRRSPSTPPKLSTSPPPRRSSVHRRGRSLTPVPQRSPSVRSSSSPSPTRRHSLRRGSPRRIARSPLQSPGQRVRSREEYSPDRRASPAELLSKSRTVLKSAESKPVVLRSPQRDVLDPKNLHRNERHSPPSRNTSRSGNLSPHGSPYTKRDRKSHPENLGSLSKAVESKSHRDETGTRVDAKDNFSRREFEDPKRSSSGKVSPTSVRRKDSIDSAEVHGIADVTKAKSTELTRSEKQPDRLDRKEHSERQGLSTIHEETDVSKKGREQYDSYKVAEKKLEKNGAMDSTPIKVTDDPAIKGKEKRKHRKSDDYSSEDSHVERREAKKRKKEEKKLKKEERRRRREERRRKKEEKRKLKSVDSGSSSSDIERDHSEDDSIRRRDSRSNTQDTQSQQKKLEIELREKALESLRARRGSGN